MTDTANIKIDDAVLVGQCQHGDTAAAERLIIRYQNRIYNTILKICANPHDAEELTQDTFVKVLENIDGFQGKSSFYTWLFRIAVNQTLNYCKRIAKLGVSSLSSEFEEQAKGALGDILTDKNCPAPAEIAANNELCEILSTAIASLDEPQKAVIVLRDIEGMNYAEIAEVLEIELGTVKSRLSRARKTLRQILEAVSK